MRFIFAISIAAGFCLASGTIAASSVAEPITSIENTPERLIIEWHATGIRTQPVMEAGMAAMLVSFDGQNTELGDLDEPQLPGYSLYAGVPLSGDIAVQFEPESVITLPLAHPVKTWARARDVPDPPRFDAPWISRPHYAWFAGRRAARIVISPLVYDASSGTLRACVRARCTIRFPAAAVSGGVAAARSDYETMLRRLIVNYDVASRWAKPRSALPRRLAGAAHPLSQGTLVTFPVGDGDSAYNEALVAENGLYRITAADLSALGTSLPIGRIAVYASCKGPMDLPAPGVSTMPDGVAEVPAVRIDNNGNGVLDGNDCLLVYATGSSDWEYADDFGAKDWAFNLDRCEDYRHYWVTIRESGGALAMARWTPPSISGNDTLRRFTDHALYRRPTALPMGSEGGIDLIWQKLTGAAKLDFTANLPGRIRPSVAAVRFIGYSSAPTNISANNGPLCADCQERQWYALSGNDTATRLPINISVSTTDPRQFLDLDGAEFRWERSLDMTGVPAMIVYSPADSGLVTYRIGGIASDTCYLVRITAREQSISLVDAPVTNHILCFADTAGMGIRYLVCAGAGIRSIGDSVRSFSVPPDSGMVVHRLRSPHQSNYLIVTDPDFRDAARTLADHKKKYASFADPRPLIIYMQDVYREFSGGNTDPAALRNFLSWARNTWTNGLSYVLFLGAGNWDYKHAVRDEKVFVPVAIAETRDVAKCVEDFFACLDSGETYTGEPDVILGRLTCVTKQEALDEVDKIRETEDPALADFGAWRNTVVLSADDDQQGSKPDAITDHHISSESVASVILSQWPAADLRKIYLFEYPWDELYEKPEASRALINEINNGACVVNWFGHGADQLWADEHILTMASANNLINRGRYPLMASFSCSVGEFDRPGHQSLSDRLLSLSHAGAIAAIAATRTAYASSNTTLATKFYQFLFDPHAGRSLGAAYREAMANYSANKQYAFLGDPSMRFVNPRFGISLEIIDANGRNADTLKALQTVTIRGRVGELDSAGIPAGTASAFGSLSPAWVQIGFYNPYDTAQRKDGSSHSIVPYLMPGAPVFVGRTQVHSGAFEQTVFIPRNVAFEKPGVRLTAFAWQDAVDAVGYDGDVVFKGTDIVATTDTMGPAIAIRPVYYDSRRNARAAFTDRVSLSLPAEVEICLSDPSGIDVVGTAPNEGLTIEIPGVLPRQNINHKFHFNEGDFRSGVAVVNFESGAMRPGDYALDVSAQDLLGKTAVRAFSLRVMAEDAFSLDHVFNYPNPMPVGGATRFYFYASTPSLLGTANDGITATVRIYALSGKLLRVLRSQNGALQNGVLWDGTDELGNVLGPNIYLYQVIADNTLQQQQQPERVKSAIRKLVIKPH